MNDFRSHSITLLFYDTSHPTFGGQCVLGTDCSTVRMEDEAGGKQAWKD